MSSKRLQVRDAEARHEVEGLFTASWLANGKAFEAVRGTVRPDFLHGEYRMLFVAGCELLEDGEEVTPQGVAIQAGLKVAPTVALASQGSGFIEDVQRYAKVLAEYAVHGTLDAALLLNEPDSFERLAAVRHALEQAEGYVAAPSRQNQNEALADFLVYLDARREGAERPIPTGLLTLDRLLGGGLLPSDYTILGGVPGAGKSALSLQLCVAAAQAGRRAVYVSGEMSRNELLGRAVGMLSGIPIDLTLERGLCERTRPALEALSRLLKNSSTA